MAVANRCCQGLRLPTGMRYATYRSARAGGEPFLIPEMSCCFFCSICSRPMINGSLVASNQCLVLLGSQAFQCCLHSEEKLTREGKTLNTWQVHQDSSVLQLPFLRVWLCKRTKPTLNQASTNPKPQYQTHPKPRLDPHSPDAKPTLTQARTPKPLQREKLNPQP